MTKWQKAYKMWVTWDFLKKLREIKKGGVYTLLRLRSAEFSKAFDLRNLCYSKISVVMLLEYRIAGILRKLVRTEKYALHPNAEFRWP